MATYPVFVVNFTTHKDGDVVAAADPNTIQAEVTAIETTLGAMPHVSTTNASSGVYQNTAKTYASVAARLANIEQGIVSDAHTQYVHLTGGDVIAPQAGTVGLTVRAPASPTTPIFQVTNNGGTPVFYIDSALVPRLVSGAAVVDTTSAQTLTSKTLTTPVIAQIVNSGTLTLPTTTDTLVGRTTTDTLTNKTLTTPVISQIVNTGTLTLPTVTDTLVARTTTDTLTNKTLVSPVITQIVNTGTLTLPTTTDTLVGRTTTDTLTNKTLTTPTIAQILNGAGTLTLPSTNDVLVGRATTDTLTNKTLTAPTIGDFTNANHNHSNAAGGAALLQANTHGSADTDVATTSLHHTIGAGANQASAGNHLHTGVYQAAGSYAASSHTHAETDVTSLTTDLGNKSAVGHTHTLSNVTDIANVAPAWTNVTGRPLTNIRGGAATVTFTSGAGTVAHGLGTTPTGAAVTSVSGGGTNVVVMLDGPTEFDGTNLKLRATNVAASTNFSGSVTLSWIAFA